MKISVFIIICGLALVSNNSNASGSNDSVKMVFYTDGSVSIYNNGSTVLYNKSEWKNNKIINNCFTIDSMDYSIDGIEFDNFNSQKNANYDLYIEYCGKLYQNLILNYKNNPLYIPRLHLKKIGRIDIESASERHPGNVQIYGIFDDQAFFNQKLLRNYDNTIIKPDIALLCDVVKDWGSYTKFVISKWLFKIRSLARSTYRYFAN